ncbi:MULTISPECIES: ABC transporter ATP-binding protein [Streptomyces]|uniref:ABC transporter ATP-binding protein n=1 Tax=Streptomyces TaxID=1883 RepID=UPI00073DBD89|nr:ABC transporter ATP-binding protein [Streptomyces sp. EAS-AB2608]BCM71575.1 putative ABC transporter ATP-binding protein [Streptomyces sp. EAS-AB2608]CUW27059.1 Spermidine/putrescine import ATP-binding protein PotA [Streptomyces reticuli]
MTNPHPATDEAADSPGPSVTPSHAPAPPAAPDGAQSPPGPPAPGDKSRTGGADGNPPPAEGRRHPATHARPRPDPAPGLDAHLVVDRTAFRLDVTLTAAPGDVLALLGPNGAGKTTALRALAGLTPLTAGHLRLDGTSLEHTPPESRPVGVVFQDYLLFPHLSALDNVAFGPRCRGAGKAEARALAAAWLDRMGLSEHAASKPRHLSGGQAQRVALARALATHPRLLLLDEPLAALDARTRLEVRAQLRRHLAAFDAVSVLVTHDPLDAMVLADRLVVVEDGRVVQEGTPADIAGHPRTDYIAQLVGLNLYRGQATGHTVRLDAGPSITTTEELSGPVFVAFPPSAVTLFRDRPSGASARNLWRCEVAGLETHGDQIRADLTGELPLAADLTTVAAAELDLHPGAPVWATVKATQTHAYPA